MASDSPTEVRKAALLARQLSAALDAIEAQLDTLNLGGDPDVVAAAMAEPIRAFDAAAKEAML